MNGRIHATARMKATGVLVLTPTSDCIVEDRMTKRQYAISFTENDIAYQSYDGEFVVSVDDRVKKDVISAGIISALLVTKRSGWFELAGEKIVQVLTD